MFRWFRRKSAPALPLAEQLRVLAEHGIRPAAGVTAETLLAQFGAADYEADPFRLLLCVLGGEDADGYGRGERAWFSQDIWHFDTECIEDHGDYVVIAERLAALSKGALPLTDVEDSVDVEDGEARLSFKLDGQLHVLEPAVDDDWVDPLVLTRMTELLDGRGTGRRFTYVDLEGQDCLIGCSTDAERRALAQATGLKVEWLR